MSHEDALRAKAAEGRYTGSACGVARDGWVPSFLRTEGGYSARVEWRDDAGPGDPPWKATISSPGGTHWCGYFADADSAKLAAESRLYRRAWD